MFIHVFIQENKAVKMKKKKFLYGMAACVLGAAVLAVTAQIKGSEVLAAGGSLVERIDTAEPGGKTSSPQKGNSAVTAIPEKGKKASQTEIPSAPSEPEDTAISAKASEPVKAAAGNGTVSYPDRVLAKGIRIAGIDVSSMTEARALKQIEARVEELKKSTILLKGREEGQELTVSAGDLGLEWTDRSILDTMGAYGQGSNIICRYKAKKDLEQDGADRNITLAFNRAEVSSFLESHTEIFNREAVNARLERKDGQFRVIPGKKGYVVDVDASAEKLSSLLQNGWNGEGLTAELEIRTDEPKGSEAELAQIKDVLGTFTTNYPNSGAARCKNIANGCKLVSNEVVYPGDEFSVLKHLVPFTEKNGYALAGSYLGNKVVDSLGGGICQVSTTLYNAVIQAEMKVTSRSNHSMIVSYVPASMDAAIAESSGMDFRFVNTLNHPVYIEGYTQGKSITFTVYGVEEREKGRKVSFESETLETIPSSGVEVETDASQPVGYVASAAGHTGYKAQLWKTVTMNGKQVSREVFNRSSYNATPQILTVGIAGNVTPELQEAIASKDANAIRAAAANAASAQTAPVDALTAAAGEAAKKAYSEALEAGLDTTAATQKAQEAANAVVSAAQGQTAQPQPAQ